jgi:VCBS repeat-containing protein
VFTPAANFNGAVAFTYTVRDDAGAVATATVTGSVTAVTDPVDNTEPAAVIVGEDGTIVFSAATNTLVAVSDPDNGVLTVTLTADHGLLTLSRTTGLTFAAGTGTDNATMTFSGSAAAINAALNGLQFHADADYNGAAQVSLSTLRAPDGAADLDVVAITIQPVADGVADSVTTPEDSPVSFNVLTGTNGASSDRFADPNRAVTAVSQPPAGQGSVSFAANGQLTYTPPADFTGTTSFTYTVTAGGVTETVAVTVTVTPVDDAPILDLDAASAGTGYATSYSENAAGVPIAGSISVVDIDSALTSATIMLMNPAAGDRLSVAGALPSGISARYDAATYTLTLSGSAAPAAYQSALAAIRYSSTSENPAAAPRRIDISVSDGQLSSATATTLVAVVPVNDAPAGTDAVLQAVEDTPYALTIADFGFTDAAEGDSFAGVVITSTPATGLLLLDGVAVSAGGSVTAAQIAAGSLTYVAGPDVNGAGLGAFTFRVRDDGGTANGGADTDQSVNTIRFDVAGVNDAPVSSDGAATTAEDTAISAMLPGYTDADNDVAIYRAGTTTPAHGTVRINSDGSYTYTPVANFHGTDIFSFVVDDGRGGTVEEYVTVTITPVNDAPVLTSLIPNRTRPDGATVTFDTSTYFADVDADLLSYTATGLPAGLSLDANGVITGTIDAAASQGGPDGDGVYTITLTASDPDGAVVATDFTFTITNPAPVAVNDSVATAEDTPVTFDVLDGTASGGTRDSDPDGDTLTVIDATAGSGTVTINADGTLTYVPDPDFNGTDTIVYTISDGQGGTAQAVATVVVAAQNDAPDTSPIADRLRNDGDTVAFDASGFFADVDGDTLAYSATGLPPGLAIDPATGIISGRIAASASGATGTAIYTITVTATDGQGGTSSIVYRNTVINVAPSAADDSATVAEDMAVDIAVLANDGDTDGDGIVVLRVNNQLLIVGGASVDTANGSVTLVDVAGTLMLRFVPDADYNGTESFTYTIDDGNSGIDVAVVTVLVTPVNDTPTASATLPDRVRADGQTLTYETGDFFRDPDGDDLNFVVTGLPAGLTYNLDTGLISGVLDRVASQGGPNGNGVYTVTVTAYDGPNGTGQSITRSFAITATNPGPRANNDSFTINEDVATTFAVLGNDSDPDGDPLSVISAGAGHGTVTINANNTLTYTANANFNGTDTILYTISDGNGGVSSASVTVTVNSVNDGPTADPIPALSSSDDAAINFDVSGYFNDVDAGADLDFMVVGTLPPGITFDNETGVFSGMLGADASSNSPYVITIIADDGNGGTVQQTLNWTIQNLPPRAFDDVLRVAENAGTVAGTNVLLNDVDPDNDGKVVGAVNADPTRVGQPVTGANGGTFVVNMDGSYSFDPGTAFDDLQIGESRTTFVTYLLDDTDGGFSTGVITVTVDGTNDAPVSTAIPNITGADNQSVAANPIDVAAFFDDVEGDALTFSATGLPPGLTMNAAGRITGTIASNASVTGPYTVAVTASDGRAATTRSFVYAVTNPAPIAVNDTASTVEDVAIDINVIANDGDPDGDTLFVDPTYPPQAANGVVTINPNGSLHYVPNADYNGVDTIIYRVSDGQGGLNSAVINVQVGVVNDAPVGTDIPDTARNDGDSVTIATSGYFADVDGDTLTYSVVGLPQGLSFDPATGVISGRIAASASGVTGRADYSVQVIADDNHGGSTTVTFILSAINIAPEANGDNATTSEDTAVDIAVLANDGDTDGDGVAVIRINNVALVVGSSVAISDGVVTLIDNAGVMQLRFVPNADFNGHTAFSYTIGDGNGGFDDAVVNILVVATNDAPVASAPIPDRTRADGSSVSFDVSPFFTDVDGDTLSFAATGLPPGLVFDPATGVISGTIDRNASQGGNNGRYTVTIVARDPNGTTASQSFDFTATNPPPRALNDLVTVGEDGSVTFDPVSGAGTDGGSNGADTDPDNDPLRVVTVAGGRPIALGTPVVLADGTLSMNADGTLTFVPIADFNGPVTITYTVSDGNGGTAQAVITIVVTAVDDAPTIDLNGSARGTAQADIFTEGDAPLIILSADGAAFDVEDEILTLDVALSGFVDLGQESIHLNGRVEFISGTPSSGTITFGGTDFRYSYNGSGALHLENAAGGSVPIERDAVSALLRALQYENRSDDPTMGRRSLVFTVTDRGNNVSAPGLATIDVVAVNDAPASTAIAARAADDAATVSFDVSGFFTDADDVLGYAATGLPAGLTIDAVTGVITGTIGRAASLGSPYTVVITASDGRADAQRSFVWTIVNPAPTAVDDALVVGESGSATGNVMNDGAGQDSDPDGDPLVVDRVDGDAGSVGIPVAGTTGGRFTIAADGSYSFDTNRDFEMLGSGESRVTQVTYRISDGQGGTSEATISVTVTGANDAPVATTLAARNDQDGAAITLDVAGAFADVDASDLLVFAATGLPPGLSIDAATGEIVGTITRDASTAGPYAVTVTATDRSGQTASAGFVWTVGNPAPVASDLVVTTAEERPLSGSVAASDSDGDPLVYSLAVAPAFGSLTLDASGSYTYTPEADFTGTDRFTYRADDGNGGSITATLTITVTPVDDAPVAADDSFVTPQNAPVTLDVRSNDRDPDGQPLTVTQIDGIAIATGGSVAVIGGQVRLNPDGTLTYAPRRGYSGAPQFSYTLSDGTLTATGSVAGIVSAVNDPPVIDTAIVTTPEDTLLSGQVDARDPNGDPLVFALVTGPAHGVLTFAADGSYSYAPDPDYVGSDSFVVSVADDNGGTSVATIALEVTAVNDSPVASASPVSAVEDGAASGRILATDVDGDALTYTLATPPARGTLVLAADGSYTYTPAADFFGNDSFAVTVGDGNGGSVIVTVPVTVTAVNDAPVASAAAIAIVEDGQGNGQLVARDADGDPLTYALATPPANGTVVLLADGRYIYTPRPDVNGSDSFVITVDDGRGGVVQVVVPVTIAAANDAPTASADPAATTEDAAVTGRIIAADRDGDAVSYAIGTAPRHGSVTILADGTYRYVPGADVNGSDSFTVIVSDGNGGSTSITVPVTIAAVNDAPTIAAAPVTGPAITTAAEQPVTIEILATATDRDGDRLRVSAATASSGNVVINPDGTITFVPAPGFTGAATIAYTVTDDRGGTANATIVVTVGAAEPGIGGLLALGFEDDRRDLLTNDRAIVAAAPALQPASFVAPLIVLDAVNGVRGLDGTVDLSGGTPIARAVDAIATLDGTADLSRTTAPVDTVVAALDRHRIMRSTVDRLFDNRFDPFAVEAQTGFSLRTLGEGQVMVESIVRGDVLYLEMRDQGDPGQPPLVEFQLRTRDGRPMPAWIKLDPRGLAIIERPVDADELRFIVVGIRADGTRVELPVIVQGETGEVQRDVDPPEQRGAKRLGAMIPSPGARASAEANALAKAFNR